MKNIKKVAVLVFMGIFVFCGMGYSQDRKEEVKQYVTKINPIIINIQIATRNISQKFLTYGLAAEQM
ncbi:MAG: hypothetical protein WC312_01740, partial [Candidatus Omnitrophota bacterium]